jgi:Na+-transporting methylmalonyl-CoA/oxaloacetate decarboxylase gamma subunit
LVLAFLALLVLATVAVLSEIVPARVLESTTPTQVLPVRTQRPKRPQLTASAATTAAVAALLQTQPSAQIRGACRRTRFHCMAGE